MTLLNIWRWILWKKKRALGAAGTQRQQQKGQILKDFMSTKNWQRMNECLHRARMKVVWGINKTSWNPKHVATLLVCFLAYSRFLNDSEWSVFFLFFLNSFAFPGSGPHMDLPHCSPVMTQTNQRPHRLVSCRCSQSEIGKSHNPYKDFLFYNSMPKNSFVWF